MKNTTLFVILILIIGLMWISSSNEKDIQRLTEENLELTARVDSLMIEYYATNIEWGLYTIKYK